METHHELSQHASQCVISVHLRWSFGKITRIQQEFRGYLERIK